MKSYERLIILSLIPFLSGCARKGKDPLSESISGDVSESESISGDVSESEIISETAPTYRGYKLYWEDNFEGEELNEDYWSYMLGDGSPNVGWGNHEKQFYTKDNVSIRNNQLVITARKEEMRGYHFTSTRLRTALKVHFKYGRVEARISLPEVQGMWPAFWMLPETSYKGQGWPFNGEIDIMEARGRVIDGYTGAVHYAGASGHLYEVVSHKFNGEGRSAKPEEEWTFLHDFHLYSLEWDEDELRWFCDNEEIGKVSKRAWKRTLEDGSEYSPFDEEFHLLLNLAVGGNFDDGIMPPNDFEEAEMIVDSVRIYTYDD